MTRGEVHGGNRSASSRRTGIPEDELIDFSASISPQGVPESVLRALKRHVLDLPHYPEPFAEELSQSIEKRYRLERGSVLCGNGSTELIYLLPRALRPRQVLLTAPTFSEYERACKATGARVVRLPLRSDDEFRIREDEFIRFMKGNGAGPCSMAFLCNPNNPTGQLLGKRAVMEIAAAARRLKCYLVVDEAFADFCPGSSVIGEVRNNPYLIVLRSMTKFYALAGLRIGYCVLPRSVSDKVWDQKEPWSVNRLAQTAGLAALRDAPYARSTLEQMKREKNFIERSLTQAGIEFVRSQANYYLVRIENARSVVAALEQKGILVRDCSNFAGLDGSYVRFAVRSRKENRILMKELAAAAAGA